jgi:putative ABC transport system permease protein
VLPARFVFALNECDVWRPLPLTAVQAARNGDLVRVVARLHRGVSPSQLETELDPIGGTAPPTRVVATRIATAIAGNSATTLMLLGGAATIAVLIAFTNLAGLLIVRSIDRRRELAVRIALGARRAEIAKQLVLEAEALALIGIAGGVLLALWITPAAGRLAAEQFGSVAAGNIALSWRVVGVVAMCALVCAGWCGCVPTLASGHRIDVDALRRGATPSKREVTLRRVFVAGEVAIACALLVSMTVVGRSLLGILAVDPGFDASGVLTLHISLPAAAYPEARTAQFYDSLQTALQERLGPRTVSTVDELPLTGDRGRFVVSAREAEAGREAVVRTAAVGYFDVMRIPLVAGRQFDRGDDAGATPRAVVSQTFAAQLFPSQNAIGRHVWLDAARQPREIVGVVSDVKHRALDDPPLPTVYLSALQTPSRSSSVVIRSARPDADLIAMVREEVARLDGNLPVYGARAMADLVRVSPGVPARRVLTATFVTFAALAVVLGTIGLFGVAAHDAARRRQELALRIALGADPSRIVRATLAQGAWIVAAGLAVGGVLSIGAARVVSTLVMSPQAFDIVSIGVAAVILVAAGIAAVLPVALRAARIDPISALRSE